MVWAWAKCLGVGAVGGGGRRSTERTRRRRRERNALCAAVAEAAGHRGTTCYRRMLGRQQLAVCHMAPLLLYVHLTYQSSPEKEGGDGGTNHSPLLKASSPVRLSHKRRAAVTCWVVDAVCPYPDERSESRGWNYVENSHPERRQPELGWMTGALPETQHGRSY